MVEEYIYEAHVYVCVHIYIFPCICIGTYAYMYLYIRIYKDMYYKIEEGVTSLKIYSQSQITNHNFFIVYLFIFYYYYIHSVN